MLYLKPEMEIVKINLEELVYTSGEIDNIGDGSGQLPKPDINYNPTQQP